MFGDLEFEHLHIPAGGEVLMACFAEQALACCLALLQCCWR